LFSLNGMMIAILDFDNSFIEASTIIGCEKERI